MKITIGFPEVALVTSVFFYPQSMWIGLTLLLVAICGKFGDYLIKHQSELERKKDLKEASDALKESLQALSPP